MLESRLSSGIPGAGTAYPVMEADIALGRTNFRAIGPGTVGGPVKFRFGLETGSSKLTIVGPWVAPEKDARSSVGSCMAGWKVIPGIVTSLIPAPSGGSPCRFGRRTALILMVRFRVSPGATVTQTGLFPIGMNRRTEPLFVLMMTCLMLGRFAESSSGVMPILVSRIAWSKLIDIDWSTECLTRDATQAVAGSPSNAEAGPSDGSVATRSCDPYEVADTDAAPIGAATVCESTADEPYARGVVSGSFARWCGPSK